MKSMLISRTRSKDSRQVFTFTNDFYGRHQNVDKVSYFSIARFTPILFPYFSSQTNSSHIPNSVALCEQGTFAKIKL